MTTIVKLIDRVKFFNEKTHFSKRFQSHASSRFTLLPVMMTVCPKDVFIANAAAEYIDSPLVDSAVGVYSIVRTIQTKRVVKTLVALNAASALNGIVGAMTECLIDLHREK